MDPGLLRARSTGRTMVLGRGILKAGLLLAACSQGRRLA
jgi:hypothetical protein